MFKLPLKKFANYNFWISFTLIVVLDQLLKLFVLKIYPGIVYVSSGVFSHFNFAWAGILPAFLVVIFIIFQETFFKETITAVTFGALLGAAISNLIDRIFRHSVLDWIPIFGVKFNFADMILIIGSMILIINLWQKPEDSKK
ncbi:MAG TPA: signal peptidase II [Patescibacteria group bacterium]|nr:signal peptidase II [Patescibacteria group bacterium]